MINRIQPKEITAPPEFKEWIQDWLLGPLLEEALAQGLAGFQQQFDFRAEGEQRITVRTALFRDAERRGRPTLMLDFDAFRTGYRPFDCANIETTTDRLNDLILQLFQRSITPKCYEEFANVRSA